MEKPIRMAIEEGGNVEEFLTYTTNPKTEARSVHVNTNSASLKWAVVPDNETDPEYWDWNTVIR